MPLEGKGGCSLSVLGRGLQPRLDCLLPVPGALFLARSEAYEEDGGAAAALLEKEPVPLAAGAAGGSGHPQAAPTPLEAAPDAHQNQASRLLGHGAAPSPADREGGRHGHERPSRPEEVSHVLAVFVPRDHHHQRRRRPQPQPRGQAVGSKRFYHVRVGVAAGEEPRYSGIAKGCA